MTSKASSRKIHRTPARGRSSIVASESANSSVEKSPGRSRIDLALTVWTVVWVAAMVVSLFVGFLDRLVIGAWHGRIGLDFFSVPRSFLNLLDGKSIFLTDAGSFGPYASWYPYHPILSLLVGSWTAQFAPVTAYLLFVAVSLGLLALCAWRLARRTGEPRQLAWAALFCAFPTYLMLWNGQMHVFTVVAATFLLLGILSLADAGDARAAASGRRDVFIGLLASLLSKPLLLPIVPLLLLVRETRRVALAALGVYAVVSAAFLFVPGFNPGGMNKIHWSNIIKVSTTANYMGGAVSEVPRSEDTELFCLPSFLDHAIGRTTSSMVYQLPLLAVAVLSFAAGFAKSRGERVRLAVVTVLVSLYAYYLCYPIVWEYHYTTLLPTLPVLVLLYKSEPSRMNRRLLGMALGLSLFCFLPTPFFLFTASAPDHLTLGRAFRVLPVLGMYAATVAYGVRLFTRPTAVSPDAVRAWGRNVSVALFNWRVALALVLLIAGGLLSFGSRLAQGSLLYALNSPLSNRPEWNGVVMCKARVRLSPRDAPAWFDLGAALAGAGDRQEAETCLRKAAELDPHSPDYVTGLGDLASATDRQAAAAYYRRALALQGDFPGAHRGLASLLFGSNPEQAIEHYRIALRGEPGDATAHLALAALLEGRGDDRAALSEYQEAARLSPELETNIKFVQMISALQQKAGVPASLPSHVP